MNKRAIETATQSLLDRFPAILTRERAEAWVREVFMALPHLRAGREDIARIIDPVAFDVRNTWMELRSHQEDREKAFAKADAILSIPAVQGEERVPEGELEPHPYAPSALHMGDCAVCGHLQDAAIHSPFRRAATPPTPAPEGEWRCGNCNDKVEPEWKYCAHCGSTPDWTYLHAPPVAKPKAKP